MALHGDHYGKFAAVLRTNLPSITTDHRIVTKNASPALEALARNLQKLMADATPKMSKAALARSASVDEKTVARILDKQNEPSLDKVSAVAKVFSKDPWELIHPECGAADLGLAAALKRVISALDQLQGAQRVAAENRLHQLIDLPDSAKGLEKALEALNQSGGASSNWGGLGATGTHGT